MLENNTNLGEKLSRNDVTAFLINVSGHAITVFELSMMLTMNAQEVNRFLEVAKFLG